MCFCSTQSMSHCLSKALPQRQRSLLCGQTPVAATHCTGSPSLLVTLGGERCCTKEASGWSGIPAEDVPVDGFIPLDWMLYKAPSDGKWGEHEHNNFLPVDSSSPFSLGILGQGSDVLQVSYPWSWMACKSPDVHVIWQLITRCSSFETWRLIQNPDEVAGVEYVSHVSQGSSQGAADESWRGWGGSSESVSLVRIRWWTIALLR